MPFDASRIPPGSRSAGVPALPTLIRLPLRETHFRAMGCAIDVLVLGGSDRLLDLATSRVRELDRGWSRFIPDGELSRFNARAGHTTRVTPDLLVLLRRGLAGFRLSSGLFNPFLGRQIIQAGYDRDYDELVPAPSTEPATETPATQAWSGRRARPRPRRGLVAPLHLNVTRRLARLDPDVQFDSGGIGKGLGADLVVAHLLENGAAGVMVSLGGDVAVGGSYPDQGWRIGIADPFDRDNVPARSVVLRAGALCSSGTLKRRWRTPDGSSAHHILDPTTGRPLRGNGIVAVSAVAPAGWRAEVLTKAALVGGLPVAQRLAARHRDCALLLWNESGELVSAG
ncbi:MAG: FAD:protein FMN transferase [Actinomycetes bacterium]